MRKETRMKLEICHLYPDLMKIYGDRGNIEVLKKRCEWRGIEVAVNDLGITSTHSCESADMFFIGGGQDREQTIVCENLKQKAGKTILEAVEDGAPLLSVCGGYQLLGREFLTVDGEVLEGLGLFNVKTIGGERRFIGDVLAVSSIGAFPMFLIGFENHGGITSLIDEAEPLAYVVSGHGNNGNDKTEGCITKNAVGTYLHGCLLPKNQWLADWLIGKAIERKYGKSSLKELDDSLEKMARCSVIKQKFKKGEIKKAMKKGVLI